MNTYLLPVVISDNDYPIQSSTSTLTVNVCACDSRGNVQSCNTEALLSAGLSTGALVAILLCVIILLSKYYYQLHWYRQSTALCRAHKALFKCSELYGIWCHLGDAQIRVRALN